MDKRQTIHYDSHRKLSLRITLPMSKESSWKSLESRVREIASYIWNAPAEPEELHGVKVDAVLKLEHDRWILVEVTENRSLEKLRNDLSKFAAVKTCPDGPRNSCFLLLCDSNHAHGFNSDNR